MKQWSKFLFSLSFCMWVARRSAQFTERLSVGSCICLLDVAPPSRGRWFCLHSRAGITVASSPGPGESYLLPETLTLFGGGLRPGNLGHSLKYVHLLYIFFKR